MICDVREYDGLCPYTLLYHSHKSSDMRYDYITIFGKFFFYPSSYGTLTLYDIYTFQDLGGYHVCADYSEAVCFAEAQY